jgi:hypothetical protein
MIKPYTPVAEVLSEINKFIVAQSDMCSDQLYDAQDTDHGEFIAGQLQAYTTIYNFLAACFTLPAEEAE